LTRRASFARAERAAALPPRGLQREVAAGYVGISSTKFDQMVLDGRMPHPKRIDGRKVWDREALDMAFDALPDEVPPNDWDDVLTQ
jgi:predicted DNA-binding transcriptional regulator AlpA